MEEILDALLQPTARLPLSQVQLSQLGSQVQRAADDGRSALLQYDADEVCNVINAALSTPDGAKALKVLLYASRTSDADTSPDAEKLRSLRSQLCERLAAAVHALPELDQAKAALLPIQLELPHLQRKDCRTLLQSCLSAVEDSKQHWEELLQLMPGCINRLMASGPGMSLAMPGALLAAADTQGDDDVGEGTAHRDAALHRLLQCAWQPQQVVPLLLVLRDVPITQEQLLLVMHKALKTCRTTELRDIPSIIHHVLLLSAAGARSMALRGISALMDSLARLPQHQAPGGSGPSTTLMQMQGTVLIHISTLLKYDAVLGADWLKYLKSGGLTASPFLLEVVLTMCKQQRLEPAILQLLKKSLVQGYEQQQRGRSRWLPSPAGGSGSGTTAGTTSSNSSNRPAAGGSLAAALLEAIRASSCATELVAPAAIKLAEQLMSVALKAPLHLIIACQPQGSLPPTAAAATCACHLGLQLLLSVFDHHSEARGELLRLCSEHLQCSKPEAALPFILLFGSICRSQPALLCQHLPQLKECLAQLPALGSDDAALALLLALWPLCRLHSDLQDHLLLLLRKALISREVACRLVAVKGFVQLILRQLQSGPAPPLLPDSSASFSQASSSQASLSQMPALSGGTSGISLLQELSGVLRRALTQQAPVRAALYEGLLQVVRADPGALHILCDLLLPHITRLVEPSPQQLPPLKMHLCATVQLGQPQLVEPLPALFACVRRLAALQGPPVGGSEGMAELEAQLMERDSAAAMQACFVGLRERLLRCEVEHFGLDRSADWSPFTPEGVVSHLHAANLLGVVEVLLEDICMDCAALAPDAPAQEAQRLVQQFSAAFALHSRVYALALSARSAAGKKEKAEGGGPGTVGTAGSKRARPTGDYVPVEARTPQLSASCLAALCNAVLEDRLLPSWQEDAAAAAEDDDAGMLGLPAANSNDAGNSQDSGARAAAGGSCEQQQQRLVRDARFRAFVLRSCARHLEAARRGATHALLVSGASGETAREWQLLAPALFKVAKAILTTCTPGGRTVAASSSGGPGSGAGGRGAGAAKSSPASSETLEQLAAAALWQLLLLGDETLQLEELFQVLPAASPAPAPAPAVDGDAGPGQQAEDCSLVTAVGPRLPLLQECVDKLMQASCFKEAQVMVEGLLMLGKRLMARTPGSNTPAAVAALSRWARACCNQAQPQVTLSPLVKALLEVWVRFQGAADLEALGVIAGDIQFVVGDANAETQESQLQGRQLPILNIDRTAQPNAAMVLAYLLEGAGELEELASSWVKATSGSADVELAQAPGGGSSTQQLKQLAAAACTRALQLVRILSTCLNTMFGMTSITEQQVRVATAMYKCLGVLAKLHTPPKPPSKAAAAAAAAAAAGGSGGVGVAVAGGSGAGPTGPGLTPEFKALVLAVHKDMTPPLYSFLQDTQEMDDKLTGKQALSRAKKDAKAIPALVFQVEDWEKQLVLAGRRGSVNLMAGAKRSVARDFKLEAPEGSQGQARRGNSQQRASGQPQPRSQPAAAAAAAAGEEAEGMDVSEPEDDGASGEAGLEDGLMDDEEEELLQAEGLGDDEEEEEEDPDRLLEDKELDPEGSGPAAKRQHRQQQQPKAKRHPAGARQPSSGAAGAPMKGAAAAPGPGGAKPRPKALGMSRRPPLHPLHNK